MLGQEPQQFVVRRAANRRGRQPDVQTVVTALDPPTRRAQMHGDREPLRHVVIRLCLQKQRHAEFVDSDGAWCAPGRPVRIVR